MKYSTNKNRNLIREVFSSIASKYDIMNDLMSFGSHRLWKRKFVKMIDVKNGDNFLDLSCGTGDIARLIFAKNENISSIICDPEEKMLEIAKSNLINSGIAQSKFDLECKTAEDLDFIEQFNFITLSFGARNFSNLDLSLKNCFNALRSGGKFYCMEFSPSVSNEIFSMVYNQHLSKTLPILGKIVAKDENSYKYLAESIKNFIVPSQFLEKMKNSGFKNCQNYPILFGAVQIYFGEKFNH